jgi:hypothetical protein
MTNRERIEGLLADVSRRREEAEAEAGQAAESLLRLASGLVPLQQCDPDRVRAAADELAGAVERLRLLAGFARELRALLM